MTYDDMTPAACLRRVIARRDREQEEDVVERSGKELGFCLVCEEVLSERGLCGRCARARRRQRE